MEGKVLQRTPLDAKGHVSRIAKELMEVRLGDELMQGM